MRAFYKFAIITMLILSGPAASFAQEGHTISGYISETGSMELLIGVNIYIPSLNKGTVSNRYGFYSITLLPGNYEVQYSYVGYEVQKVQLDLIRDTTIDISIKSSIELQGVEISAERYEKISEMVQMSKIELPVSQISDIPALLGEKDVFKVLQLMPGVQSGSEGSSGLYVRGGGPDQNLIILDDALVYNANHLFGFFSLFNGDALKSIELIKGGFPARYGGRLSSVVEMNMKDGNKEKFGGKFGIGLISSKLTLEGPVVKGKSSFLISGRRTYIDALTRPFMPPDEKVGYYFYDLNAKINYDFGPKNKLYLSTYFGRDKFGIKETYGNEVNKGGIFWENFTGTIRWNHLFSNKIFANTSLIFSNYRLKFYEESRYEDERYSLDYRSSIRDLSLKYDLEYYWGSTQIIRVGGIATWHRFIPSAVVIQDSYINEFESVIKEIHTMESALYIEDEVKFSSRFLVNAGLRLSHFLQGNKHYLRPEPRFAASYMISNDLSVKASYALMNQYVHLLSNTGLGLPTDLWVPSTQNILPQRSQQVAIGIAKDIAKPRLAISLEGYYKKSDDIIGYKEGATFLLIEDPTGAENFTWEDNITSGQGWSYGVELLVQKKFGQFSGWIGYTLSWTQLQFDDLNFGKKYYAKHDRRHDVSIVAIYKLKENITISGTWVYGTGNALTMPQAEYAAITHLPGISNPDNSIWEYFNYRLVSDFGEKNSFRMEAYHRMDVGIQFHKQRKKYKRTWEISAYNVYSHKNAFFYYIESNPYVNDGKRVLKKVTLFPIIPSIAFNIEF